MMRKIFRTKKQRKTKQKEQSVFGYFTMDREKFMFYLGAAGMKLLPIGEDLYEEIYYKITKTNDFKYPYHIYYEIKPFHSVVDMKYMITLKLSEKEFLSLKDNLSKEEVTLYHVDEVMVYDQHAMEVYDFFDLSEEKIEEVNINLFIAYSMLANYNYVPSPADGEFGTSYKRIRQ